MASIDFETEKQHYLTIKKRLSRRGLKLCYYNWEVYFPQGSDFPYQVYVGPVNDPDGSEFYVAIYPRAIYYIDNPDDWWNTKPENKILAAKEEA